MSGRQRCARAALFGIAYCAIFSFLLYAATVDAYKAAREHRAAWGY